MLATTTPTIEGKRITKYYGIVTGETIIGANLFRDFFASIRDIVAVVPVLMKKYFDRLKILRYEKCRIRLLYWELML